MFHLNVAHLLFFGRLRIRRVNHMCVRLRGRSGARCRETRRGIPVGSIRRQVERSFEFRDALELFVECGALGFQLLRVLDQPSRLRLYRVFQLLKFIH